ncbi:zinc finger domain-containing protein [Kitasatospora cineracea]
MIQQEWVVLFRYIRAMYPQQKFDEYTPDAWYEVLAGYDAQAVRTAVAACAAKKPFVAPAEIIAQIAANAANCMTDFQYEPGDPDETARQYLARRRQQIAAVTAGQRPAALPALGASPRPLELASIGRLPGAPAPQPANTPRSIRCPRCGADPGKPCKTTFRGKPMVDVHPARHDNWKAA